jgi:hypothetical protein
MLFVIAHATRGDGQKKVIVWLFDIVRVVNMFLSVWLTGWLCWEQIHAPGWDYVTIIVVCCLCCGSC